jgi:hypothetical protein
VVESLAQVEAIFAADPSSSLPDNLFCWRKICTSGVEVHEVGGGIGLGGAVGYHTAALLRGISA